MTRLSLFTSLRTRLFLLVLFALLPALGLILYTASEQRRLAQIEVQQNALRLARFASANQGQLVEGARQLLIALAQIPAVRGNDAADCNALFSNLLEEYPLYANFGVLQANGDSFCSAVPLKQVVNSADRAYFQRAIKTRDFAIGDYQIGRASGKASVNFGYPVIDQNDQITGVVFAALDLAWFNRLAAKAQMPPGSALVVFDQNGTVLARHPDPQQWVGKTALSAPLIQAILAEKQEGVIETVGIDGIPRLYAFTPIGNPSDAGMIYLTLGIPTTVAFSDTNQLLARNLSGLGLVSLLALAAAWLGSEWFILRKLEALVEATKRLRAGELGARTGLSYGLGELNQLAQAFDEMAVVIEHREEQLKAAETKYRALVEQIPAIIYTAALDRVTQLFYISPQLQPILGFTPEEWLAHPKLWLQQLHPDDGDRILEQYTYPFRTGDSLTQEYRVYTQDGRLVWIRDEAQVVQGDRGQADVLQGIMIDITDRKQAQEALRTRADELTQLTQVLERRNQELDQFAYVISHDLKAPLRAIANLSQWLEEDLEDKLTADTRQQLDLLRQRVYRMEALINGLLQYSRIGRVKTDQETVEVAALIGNVIDSLAPPSGFTIEIAPDMPILITERLPLEQVFANLINNAIKHHHRPDGHIQISGQDLGSFYEFAVADDGPGIAPQYHEKIFEIFQTLSQKTESTGIGLSLVKKTIEAHGGYIQLASQEHQGTIFRFTWPKRIIE